MKRLTIGEHQDAIQEYQKLIGTSSNNIIYVGMDEYGITADKCLVTSNLGSCTALGLILDDEVFLAHVAPSTNSQELIQIISTHFLKQPRVPRNLIIQLWFPATPMMSDITIIKTFNSLGLIESVFNLDLIKQRVEEHFLNKLREARGLTAQFGVDVVTPLLSGNFMKSIIQLKQMKNISSEEDAIFTYELIKGLFFYSDQNQFKELFKIPIYVVGTKEEFIAIDKSVGRPRLGL